jgi:hypothetical protein
MRLVSRLSVFALVLGASIAVTRFGDVEAAPKLPIPTAIVEFDDSKDVDDNFIYSFHSDGGSYVNGVNNVAARFYAGGSGDLTLNLVDSTRKFHGTVVCAGGTCSPPSAQFTDGWFLNIHKISDMVVGETRLTQAGFIAAFGVQQKGKSGYGTHYNFGWCHDGTGTSDDWDPPLFTIAPQPNGCLGKEGNGSQMVLVFRTTIGGVRTWTVSTDPVAGTPVGPISELSVATTNSESPLGLYNTSFRLTIRCQTDQAGQTGCDNGNFPTP